MGTNSGTIQDCQKTKKAITRNELRKLLKYDKKTGVFTWVSAPARRIKVGTVAGKKNIKDGYMRVMLKGKEYLMHRLVVLYVKGYFPEHQVDHKDRIRHHNWWDNLREVTQACNSRNRNINKNNKSGVTGVYFYAAQKQWRANIRNNGKIIHLGGYSTIAEAAKVRHEAEIKFNYPDCLTNSTAKKYLDELEALR